MAKIIETAHLDMSVEDFARMFPSVPLTVGEKKDYDPSFWKKTIRHMKYASSHETIAGVDFAVSVSFFRDRLSFLQYYGETGSGRPGFDASLGAFEFLFARIEERLGPPVESTRPGVDYVSFLAAPRSSSGPPDDRYVEIAGASWGSGYLVCSEDAYGKVVTQLRLGR